MPTQIQKSSSVDTGWSWVVLFGACVVMCLWQGTEKALSVLLPTLKEEFETHTWIIGLTITLMGTMRDLGGPIVGVCTSVVSSRTIAIIGGTTVGLAITCASFASNVYLLVLLVSFVTGLAYASIIVTSLTLLAQYFDKLYPLASGLVYTCQSIGLMIFAPLTQCLLESYGWRGALIIIGGILFHLVACGVLFRTPSFEGTNIVSSNNELDCSYACVDSVETIPSVEETKVCSWKDTFRTTPIFKRFELFMQISGLSLFKNFSFVAVCVMMAAMNASFSGWVIYFIPHCLAKGLPAHESSLLAAIGGLANLLGHLIYIPFVLKNIISARGFALMSCIVAAISLFVDTFTDTFATLLIPTILYGGGIGAAYPLCDVCLKSVVDKEVLPKAFGWRLALSGLCRIAPGFIVGWIYDTTGSYDGGYYFLGAFQTIGVFFLAADYVRQDMMK